MAGTDSGGNDLLVVTGASGFVGSAIAIAARAAGYRVRVLVRRSSPRINIQPDDEVVIGDIRDRASLVPALRGVRYLAHAAADYRLWAPPPDD
ncbi:MAG: NAD-dependent epimerase/dehydratase family protein, partial [Xanthobacteraceae bacterium]